MERRTWKYGLLVLVLMVWGGCVHGRVAEEEQSADTADEAVSGERTAGTVAVGYGVQRAEDVTGAVSSVQTDEEMNGPVRHLGELLQGRVAGVTVFQRGSGFSVRIRGRNSFYGSNEPLYVVDGVPIKTGPDGLLFINPHDVAAIDVLKDASATAIYGSRGSNGVVIITTRRGH